MPEINTNTNSYYTPSAKVERRPKTAVVAPIDLPSQNLISDSDVELRWKNINHDIYSDTKAQQKNSKKTFIKWFGITLGTLLCLRWVRAIFKK